MNSKQAMVLILLFVSLTIVQTIRIHDMEKQAEVVSAALAECNVIAQRSTWQHIRHMFD